MTVFLAGGTLLTRKRLYRRIYRRLSDLPEFSGVRYEPSTIRPRRVRAGVDPALFVDGSYPGEDAQLIVEFDLRGGNERPHYWLTWVEPDAGFSCGWHQNATHDELGPCHWQVDYRADTAREAASFLDTHPYAVFERRLAELPDRLRDLPASVHAGDSGSGPASAAGDRADERP